MNKRKIGAEYEQRAREYLQEHHYEILESNYRCRYGEIDVIARDKEDGYLSFVEVKYRRNLSYGFPAEAVDGRKQKRIAAASMAYIREKRLPADFRYRYDVVSIYQNQITLIKNAFEIRLPQSRLL